MQVNQFFRQGKTDTGALFVGVILFALIKAVKNLVEFLSSNSLAAVFHLNCNDIIFKSCLEHDRSANRRKFEGVRQQVVQYFFNFVDVYHAFNILRWKEQRKSDLPGVSQRKNDP